MPEVDLPADMELSEPTHLNLFFFLLGPFFERETCPFEPVVFLPEI
jgi:hypothetical protein